MPLRYLLRTATELGLLNMTNTYDLIEMIHTKDKIETKALKDYINIQNLKERISNILIIRSLNEIQKSNWWLNILSLEKNSAVKFYFKKENLIVFLIFHLYIFSF